MQCPDQRLTVMPSPHCRICMALPVIQSSSPDHTCCNTVQLCLLQCSLPLLEYSCMLCSTPCLLPCLAAVAAAAPPAGRCMSVDCTGQLLWVADRCPLRQVFCAWRLQPLRLACCTSGLLRSPCSPPSQLRLFGSALCLLAGLLRKRNCARCAALQMWLAGLLHVC